MSVCGTFEFNGATFNCQFRDSTNPSWNQRCFSKCLIINNGKTEDGKPTDGHNYFGDDKFEVSDAYLRGDTYVLTLKNPLRWVDDMWVSTDTIELKNLKR